jgi:hypothetical protein
LLESTFHEDFNDSLDKDKKDKDSEIKITTEIIISVKTMNFILLAGFSRFRDTKKVILRLIKITEKNRSIKLI